MEPRLTVLTLAVDDLERAVAFYRDGCGLQHGLKMALWERGNLAHDAGVLMQPRSSTEFSLGHNVRSEAEVDAVLVQAESAGGTIVKPAGKTFWGGYAGYFADLDGHLWEVVYNPNLLPE
jgi:catechol 2,3-dioxygenase-like lactoylglutathione lyase family enzyme